MYVDWQSEKVKRIYTGLGILLGLAAAFGLRFLTVWIFDVVIVALACLAVWEVSKAKQLPSRGVPVYYLYSYIFLSYAMFVIGLTTGFAWWLHVIMQLVPILVFALYTMIMNYMDADFVKEVTLKKGNLRDSSVRTAWEFLKVVLYPFLIIATLVPINHFATFAYVLPFEGAQDLVQVAHISTFALLMVFVTSCLSDTFAYIVGRTFRGPKLFPKKYQWISPGKTISGLIGALFGGIVGAMLVLLVMTTDPLLQIFLTNQIGDSVTVQLAFVGIGLAGAIITHMGDIYASWLKRKTGIKDFGNLLPGHGGAMDRLDGISWNAVFMFFVFLIIIF